MTRSEVGPPRRGSVLRALTLPTTSLATVARAPDDTRYLAMQLAAREAIARRTLAMLREQLSEEPRLDALDRVRIGVHQRQSLWALDEPPGQELTDLVYPDS